MRGDLLPYWEAPAAVGEADRRRWLAAAERIAGGIAELAHLEAFVDAEHYRVGFSCEGDAALAGAYARAIGQENIEARQVAPPVANRAESVADEIVLPCAPGAGEEEIAHAILAAVKASHALEFEVVPEEAVAEAGDD